MEQITAISRKRIFSCCTRDRTPWPGTPLHPTEGRNGNGRGFSAINTVREAAFSRCISSAGSFRAPTVLYTLPDRRAWPHHAGGCTIAESASLWSLPSPQFQGKADSHSRHDFMSCSSSLSSGRKVRNCLSKPWPAVKSDCGGARSLYSRIFTIHIAVR